MLAGQEEMEEEEEEEDGQEEEEDLYSSEEEEDEDDDLDHDHGDPMVGVWVMLSDTLLRRKASFHSGKVGELVFGDVVDVEESLFLPAGEDHAGKLRLLGHKHYETGEEEAAAISGWFSEYSFSGARLAQQRERSPTASDAAPAEGEADTIDTVNEDEIEAAAQEEPEEERGGALTFNQLLHFLRVLAAHPRYTYENFVRGSHEALAGMKLFDLITEQTAAGRATALGTAIVARRNNVNLTVDELTGVGH